MRTFESKPAVRTRVPLIIGITGPSGSGKTFSMLRLATGIQRVKGGEIFVIDTESRRALHYADTFKFQHIDFQPDFGPLDYLDAIEHAVSRGAKIVCIDSMSHEHDGQGGVLDQVDRYLDAKAGDDAGRRKALTQVAHIGPKRDRKILNQRIVQLGDIVFILCYRAQEKKKFIKGADPIDLGYMPITTSNLVFDMTQRFLLLPGSDGKPNINPENDAEKQLVKNPSQFRGWFKSEPLNEDLGEKLARWSVGGAGAPTFWAGKDWKGKPLSAAPIDELLRYKAGCAEALAKKTGADADKMRQHIEDVDRELERARAEAALQSPATEPATGSAA